MVSPLDGSPSDSSDCSVDNVLVLVVQDAAYLMRTRAGAVQPILAVGTHWDVGSVVTLVRAIRAVVTPAADLAHLNCELCQPNGGHKQASSTAATHARSWGDGRVVANIPSGVRLRLTKRVGTARRNIVAVQAQAVPLVDVSMPHWVFRHRDSSRFCVAATPEPPALLL